LGTEAREQFFFEVTKNPGISKEVPGFWSSNYANLGNVMSDLSFLEQRKLECLFEMDGGYVLDFTDRTFQEFVADSVQRNIDDLKYGNQSKAKRLRVFWKAESNYIVGKLTEKMIEYADFQERHLDLIDECRPIAERLLHSVPVAEIDAISPNADGRDFDNLARAVREAIEKNEPESGLDRLHTFVVKYVRVLCLKHGISVGRDKALHSIFGEYVKKLQQEGRLESEMTTRILKSSISTLEAFNDVRNEQSFAHDNVILNYHESLLIFNNVASSIRFLEWIESPEQIETTENGNTSRSPTADACPF
jgi:hypothetical protein